VIGSVSGQPNPKSRYPLAQPGVARVMGALAAARRELAAQWLALPEADAQRHYAERLGHLHRTINGTGLRDALQSDEDRAFLAELKTALAGENPRQPGAGKLLAAMLFLYPHELPQAFEVEAVPAWLQRDYVAYMLNGPAMFREPAEADAYCDYAACWTKYLHDKILANAGNELWRSIGLNFTQNSWFIPLYSSTRNLRDLYRQRAAIIETSLRSLGAPVDHKFGPRPKRNRLRLGILVANCEPQSETYATMPVYRDIDRSKFEVILFALRRTNSRLEQFCARHADQFVALPPDLGARLQALRAADLDLLLIGTNTTGMTNDAAALAAHRLARVQVASVCSCVTTGMRNVDYYLSGRLSEPPEAQAHYTEKLVMMDGPAHCYDFDGEPPAAPTEPMNRAALGIPGDAIVFASGANFYKIVPEVEAAWMRVLAAVPNARLLLFPFNPNWSSYPVDAFLERLSAAAARHDVDADRLIVLRTAPHKADVLERLRLADVYLDSFPFSGATSLLDPFELALPTVVMDGGSFRALVGPALLRELAMDELIVKDANGYVALAVRLATDGNFRHAVRGRLAAKMKAAPKFLDTKWYGREVELALARMWRESGYGG